MEEREKREEECERRGRRGMRGQLGGGKMEERSVAKSKRGEGRGSGEEGERGERGQGRQRGEAGSARGLGVNSKAQEEMRGDAKRMPQRDAMIANHTPGGLFAPPPAPAPAPAPPPAPPAAFCSFHAANLALLSSRLDPPFPLFPPVEVGCRHDCISLSSTTGKIPPLSIPLLLSLGLWEGRAEGDERVHDGHGPHVDVLSAVCANRVGVEAGKASGEASGGVMGVAARRYLATASSSLPPPRHLSRCIER